MLGKGEIDITILADGTCRIETGNMAGVKHQAADQFIKELERLMGGDVKIERTKSSHLHAHDHTHGHEHQ